MGLAGEIGRSTALQRIALFPGRTSPAHFALSAQISWRAPPPRAGPSWDKEKPGLREGRHPHGDGLRIPVGQVSREVYARPGSSAAFGLPTLGAGPAPRCGAGEEGIRSGDGYSGGGLFPSYFRRGYIAEKIQMARAMIARIPTMVQINPLPRILFSFPRVQHNSNGEPLVRGVQEGKLFGDNAVRCSFTI